MISAHGVGVTYPNGVRALHPTDIRFGTGEMVVLLGPSGAGKSTLLRCLNGLVRPTQGAVAVEGIGPLTGAAALRAHRRRTGMVFQHHHLIGRRSAFDNVLTGRLGYHSGWRSLLPLPAADKRIALDCLARVGLADRALHRVDELSGGQRQRVGIARALCQRPSLILADEPVASLDPASAQAVLGDLRAICREDGIAAVVSLHQVELARRFADRIVGLAHGRVVFDAAATALEGEAVAHIYGTAVHLAA
ncbi:phosphonate ABC transporter ATP-binding protein [Azospirillum sp. A39]|uniref:phosphonate ABC transporter ATP-binding protein n=1 Tax=Azospirillum sp. A39 TaxID=3462279 RepID=UPI004045EFB9